MNRLMMFVSLELKSNPYKMIIRISAFYLFFLSKLAFSYFSESDSVIIEIYRHVSKEMIIEGEETSVTFLGMKKIDLDDQKKIDDFIHSKKYFAQRSRLLTHFNIRIIGYQKGLTKTDIEISSFTRTVYLNPTKLGIEDYGFNGIMLSTKGEKLIIKLLKKYKLLHLIQDDLRFP